MRERRRKCVAKRDVHGKKAYELYRDYGLYWEEIVAHIGGWVFGGTEVTHKTRVNNANQHAYRYAKAHGLPWPKYKAKELRLKRNGGRIYYKALSGMSFEAIAKKEGLREDTAAGYARRYAKTYGQPWPVHPRKYDRRGEQAYHLRAHGLTWKAIAEIVGFNFETRAAGAARNYANRTGSPWLGRVVAPLKPGELVPVFESEHTKVLKRLLG